MRHIIFKILLCAALSGCAAGRPDENGNPLKSILPFGAVPIYSQDGKINKLSERATHYEDISPVPIRKTNALNVLVLSGGGSNGAFGAGALVGWSESGKRPNFDIVTGISTGALMAPFAFLGSKYNDQLENLYTQTSDAGIFTSRGPLGIFKESLNDTSPLRTQLGETMTDELLDEIAAEHKKGRRLYVGTTDLDMGEAVTWDMGGIAASGKSDRKSRFVQILLASASVPGIFNPVFIHDGEGENQTSRLHVDGGVKEPLLLRDFMISGQYKQKNVYFLVNSCMCLRNIKQAVEPSFIGVTKKSIEELLRSFLYRSLQTSFIMSRNAGAKPSILYIPDHITPPDPLKFEPAKMRELFESGRAAGKTKSSWHVQPPHLERFSQGVR